MLHDLKATVMQLIKLTVTVAGAADAAAPQLGDALGGISSWAVRKRFPGAVASRPGRPGADLAGWTGKCRDELVGDPDSAFGRQLVQQYAPGRDGEERRS